MDCFLDPGGNLVGQVDTLDGYYDYQGYVKDVRILSMVETVRPSGQDNTLSVFVTENRGLAPFHRIECTPLRDSGAGGDIVTGNSGATITTRATTRSFVELASDTDQTIISSKATYINNQTGAGGMQEMQFNMPQSNQNGSFNPWFFDKKIQQGSLWLDTAYEITTYHYPMAVARFEVTDLVGSFQPSYSI